MQIDEGMCRRNRDEIMLRMHRRKIGTGVHYRAIPAMSVYRERFGWRAHDYPVANHIGQCTLSLPLSPRLDDDDVTRVIAALRESIRG